MVGLADGEKMVQEDMKVALKMDPKREKEMRELVTYIKDCKRGRDG
jgi:hypothetical protein